MSIKLKRPNAHKKSRKQRRAEAEERNARTPVERTRAYRRRMNGDPVD